MANELSVQLRLQATKGKFSHNVSVTDAFDMGAGRGGNPGVLAFTTASANVSFSPMSGPQLVYIRNLSTAASVLFCLSTTAFTTIKPTQFALIPKNNANTWNYKASTAGGTGDVDVRGFST